MRRPPKRPRTFQRRVDSDRNSVERGCIAAKQGGVVAGEGALHNRIEIGVAAAKEDVFTDSTFDRRLDSLGPKGKRIQIERKGAFTLQCRFEGLLLLRRQIRQQGGNEPGADRFNGTAKLIMKIIDSEDDSLTPESLLAAAFPC